MKSDTSILLVIPRYRVTTSKNYNYMFPLGLGYISSTLKQAGYSVDCLNLNHYDGLIVSLINNALDTKKYDFVCTGGNALMYSAIETIINSARKHESSPRIVLGGPIITSEPDLVYKALNPDFAVLGEGEETIIELLECLEQNKSLDEVKGIGYRGADGNVVFNARRDPVRDINALPIPDYEGFGFPEQIENMHTNWEYFYNEFDFPRFYMLLGSRGCPFKCTFCYHDAAYRARTIDNIMEEVELMVNRYRINSLYIIDEVFAIKKERVYEFCERIKEFRAGLSWDLRWFCQMTASGVDPVLLKTMKDSGCILISYGFESYSHTVLKSMRKPATPGYIKQALHETLKAGMGVQGSFIFGDVAETAETARETLDFWKSEGMGQIALGFIIPYPGSVMYRRAVEKGLIKDKLAFIKNDVNRSIYINMTERMTEDEFSQLKKDVYDALAKYRKYVRPLSIRNTNKNTYAVKVECPYCAETITYNNCWIKNRFTYDFYMTCRNCHMRYYIVSALKKQAFAHYSTLKDFGLFYINTREYVKKRIFNVFSSKHLGAKGN